MLFLIWWWFGYFKGISCRFMKLFVLILAFMNMKIYIRISYIWGLRFQMAFSNSREWMLSSKTLLTRDKTNHEYVLTEHIHFLWIVNQSSFGPIQLVTLVDHRHFGNQIWFWPKNVTWQKFILIPLEISIQPRLKTSQLKRTRPTSSTNLRFVENNSPEKSMGTYQNKKIRSYLIRQIIVHVFEFDI